ncbi:MAG: hypothetical protein RR101_09305 [Burkholderiaceae bacterium]
MSRRILIAFFCLLGLAACSNSPSERDIKGAIERDKLERKKNMTALLGERGAAVADQVLGRTAVKSVRKIGCQEDGENAWRCDIELEVARGDATQTRLNKVRLVRGSAGWAVSE